MKGNKIMRKRKNNQKMPCLVKNILTLRNYTMRNILLISISQVFISFSALAGLEISTPDCASLGYKTDIKECLSSKGTPLVCPFANGSDSKCICIKDSCRGYDITAEDMEQKKASDGRSINEHILSYDECTTGSGEEELTLYRVKECAEGSLYQNGLCDVGCDTVNKYPYRLHPGNLAGEVEVCKDASGEYFGYKECHGGWLGGWNNKDNPTGYCNLNDCDIKNYPYNTDPNAKKVRGTTETCRIGGNPYYKYTSCNDGYELKKSICVGSCEIDVDNCTSTAVNIDAANYPYSYNNWKCPLVDKDSCMIGDNATIDGKSIGTVFYISEDKILVMGDNQGAIRWGNGLAESTDIPTGILPNITSTALAVQDYDGKKKTNAIKAYVHSSDSDEFNDSGCTTSVTDALCSYPAAFKCYNYSTTNCNHNMCQQGEWYLPALGELGYMYDNRYMLYNVTGSTVFTNNYFWSSTERVATDAWRLNFSSGNRTNGYKYYSSVYVRPVLSF